MTRASVSSYVSLLTTGFALFSTLSATHLSAQPAIPVLPKQGLDNNGQDPNQFNAQEKAAVAITKAWFATVNDKDSNGHMALIDNDVLVRPDEAASLMYGRPRYCATMGLGDGNGYRLLNELYVVGGSAETEVLFKRTDVNSHAGAGGPFAGYPVPVATFLRIRNGKIIEWEDMPMSDMLGESLPGVGVPQGVDGPPTPSAFCQKYDDGKGSAPARRAATENSPDLNWFGQLKPEYYWTAPEKAAARAVRSWFAAWEAGDPVLLAAFVDPKITFRSKPTDALGHGRVNLLRQVCGEIGGKRKLTDLFVVGSAFDSAVLTRWDQTDQQGAVQHMSSMFRVQDGLITEWMYDVPLDTTGSSASAGAGSNASACRDVEAALSQPRVSERVN